MARREFPEADGSASPLANRAWEAPEAALRPDAVREFREEAPTVSPAAADTAFPAAAQPAFRAVPDAAPLAVIQVCSGQAFA
jgi:hypothetical protein